MANKVRYEIRINGGNKTGFPYLYKYGQTKNIELYIHSQKAAIVFEQGKKKPVEDLITFKTKLFRDAYRKVLLIHGLVYDCGLEVKTLSIQIGDETWEYNKETENFPFMFSMIQKKQMGLNLEWKEAVNEILDLPKTKKDTDLRFCAMFSFLSAKNRVYRVDRFTNLWTAMNAYGNYLAKQYEHSLGEEYDLELASKSILNVVMLYGKDGNIVNTLSLRVKRPLTIMSQPQIAELWKDYYGVQNALAKLTKEDYPELYAEAKKALDDSYELPEKYKEIDECAKRFERPLYVFLLTDYPYYLRCKLLHGSFSTILFSAYNDYEIASLGIVNYFIESYLNEELPKVFRDDYWDEDRYQEIKECLTICVSEYAKRMTSLEELAKKAGD